MGQRAKLTVGDDRWHYGIYEWWRRKASKPERTLDLCHYMRVVLFFAPWRWYWQAGNPPLAPWIVTPAVAGVTFLIFAAIAWPSATLSVLILVALATVAAALFVGLIWTGAYLVRRNPDDADHLFHLLLRPFIVTGLAIGRSARWFWFSVMEKPLRWVFMGSKALMPYGESLFAILIVLAALAGLAFGFYAAPLKVAIGFAIAVGVIGTIVGFVLAGEALGKRRKRRKLALASEPKSSSAAAIAWEWAVAKKQRICPLIEIVKTQR